MTTDALSPSLASALQSQNAMAGSSLNERDKKRLKEASQGLEAVFAGYLMAEIGQGLPGTEKSFASQTYADMFKETIAQQMAKSEALGLSKAICLDAMKLADKAVHKDAVNEMLDKAEARHNAATKTKGVL